MENIIVIVIGLLLAAFMGQTIIPRIMVISLRKRLFDEPDERKVHTRPIPRLGGVSFFPVVLFVFCLLTAYRVMKGHFPNDMFTLNVVTEMMALFAGLTLLYLIGISDDLVGVRYRTKLRIQIISSAFLVAESIAVRRAACSAARLSHKAP